MASSPIPHDLSNPAASAVRTGGRHQIKRSITDFASPAKLGRVYTQHRRERNNDDRVQTAANEYMQNMSRSEGVTPMRSAEHSRRPSLMLSRDDETRLGHVSSLLESKALRDERLREERAKTNRRVDGLKQSLDELSTVSTATSRQLDDTYYAVLEKMSTLRNTVTALKDLTEMSRSIHEGFEKESKEIEDDITTQISALGSFEVQQHSIECLQDRIVDGRAKIRSLSQRVDAVRERVERWDRLDKDSQEKTRKRLKAIWICLSIVALAVVVLYVGAGYISAGSSRLSSARLAESILETRKVAGTAQANDWDPRGSSGLARGREGADGESLRRFDEL